MSIKGKIYGSIREAARKTYSGVTTIYNRCESTDPKWKNWFYVKNSENIQSSISSLTKSSLPKKVSIEGKNFYSVYEASHELNYSRALITKRCQSQDPKWKNWFYNDLFT